MMFRTLRIQSLVIFTLMALFLGVFSASAQSQTHTVSPGETLAVIAQKYSVNFQSLASFNGIVNPNLIYAGQVLMIPAADSGAAGGGTAPTNGTLPGTTLIYYIRVADTLSEIAVDYCTTVAAIANASGINVYARIYPGQVLYIPVGYCYVNGPVYGYPPHIPPVVTHPLPLPSYGSRYVVRVGDTLYRIGAIFGVNIYSIAQANGILNLNHIYSGQTLIIPSY